VDPEKLRRNRIIAGGWEASSNVVEEYKVLRTQILHRTAEADHNTLMVTGALPDEGKTLTAINLAIILSRELNHTVLLVDADLRSPSITHYFGLEDEPGMVDYLTNGVPISELLIHPQGLGKLVILPAGRAATQAAELLNSPLMRELVQELKHYYTNRYVIFDLPPLLVYADALAFAPLVDGIIVVAEADKTPKESIQRCQEMLKKFKLLGFVLNKTGETSDAGYYRGYYYPPKREPGVKKRFKLPLFK
jgi:exopolysaccharide/PEP-CTERM locus tyrosine autokinase